MSKSSIKILKSVFKWLAAFFALLFILIVLLINILFPFKFSSEVLSYSKTFDVDYRLIYAVIWTESKFNPKAVSSAGAVGLMQLMPATASWCAEQLNEEYTYEKLFEPNFNIKIGTYYLKYLINKFGENDAIIAYNAGEGNLEKWNGEIKFKETKDYIKRVKLVKKIYSFKSK